MSGASTAADSIESALRPLGTAARAANEKRYLKSDLQHLGVPVGEIRRVVRHHLKGQPGLGHDDLVGLVHALWREPLHERRMAAVVLLQLRVGLLGPADLPFLEGLIRDSHTWAYVDALAGDTVGTIILRDPSAAVDLDRWARDANFWIRRSALLAAMKPLRNGADFSQFLRHADGMLDEEEFFIRKAIGWVLRETGKKRPEEVFEWLLPRAHRASGVTWREAIKYLSPEQQGALTRAGTGRGTTGLEYEA